MEMNWDPARTGRCAPILHGESGIGTAFEQAHVEPQEVEVLDVGSRGHPTPGAAPARKDGVHATNTTALPARVPPPGGRARAPRGAHDPRGARELGSPQVLRTWVKQSDVDVGVREGLSTEERDELRRLRREVRQLRQERDILGKAVAFFAKEPETR